MIWAPLLNLSNNTDHDLIQKLLQYKSTGTLLELCSGNCADSLEFKKLGFNVTALDNNIKYAEYGKSLGLDCNQFNIEDNLPFNDNSFDLVYSRFGLHYFSIDKVKDILLNINRVLKPDGYLIFTVKIKDDDTSTNKIIYDLKTWENVISSSFHILQYEIKSGEQYGALSQWVEFECGNKYI